MILWTTRVLCSTRLCRREYMATIPVSQLCSWYEYFAGYNPQTGKNVMTFEKWRRQYTFITTRAISTQLPIDYSKEVLQGHVLGSVWIKHLLTLPWQTFLLTMANMRIDTHPRQLHQWMATQSTTAWAHKLEIMHKPSRSLEQQSYSTNPWAGHDCSEWANRQWTADQLTSCANCLADQRLLVTGNSGLNPTFDECGFCTLQVYNYSKYTAI